MRTRLNICANNALFVSAHDTRLIAHRASVPLRPYRCDRCLLFT